MRSLFHYINALSIDVAVGAISSALFFSKLLDVKILPAGLLSLGLTVWIIYSIDHLLDARKITHEASTFRHRFYQKHFRTMLVVSIFAAIVDAIAVIWIRKPVFIGGIFLFCGVMAYLLMNRFWKIPKEVIIALLYTLGVLLPSLAITSVDMRHWPIVLMVQFFSTALTNLVLFAWFDRDHDRHDHGSSFVMQFGERKSTIFIWGLLLFNISLTIIARPFSGALILFAMNLILCALFYWQNAFARDERFRIFGDAIFVLPLLIFV